MIKRIISLSVYILTCIPGYSQTHTLNLTIKNQPENKIILGQLRGDKFIPVDSAKHIANQNNPLESSAIFSFPATYTHGMYRLIFGSTLYSKIMNEPPQQLDFIFNNEDLIFETDFNSPEKSLVINKSDENRAWFEFKAKEKMYDKWLNRLRPYIQNKIKISDKELQDKKNEYNRVLIERETFVKQSVQINEHLFASKLIKMYHEPVLDAYFSEKERVAAYKKEYFNVLDFSDEELVNSTIYTDKIIHYIQSYGEYGISREKQEDEFIKAVDIVLNKVNKNPVVYELILDYIVRGFEKLNLNKALAHIAERYSGTTCQTDEKTTLERRLGSQKMKIGSLVPDFTLNDINGDPVTLSQIIKKQTLILFWASWCPHCNELLPEINKWAKLNPDKIEIIAISIDSSKAEWQKQVLESDIESWYNLSDLKEWDGEVAENYNVYATPTMFFIDSNRRIIAKPKTLEGLISIIIN